MHITSDNQARLASVRKTLKKTGIDSLLVTDMTNVRYLTGFTGSSGFLFITATLNIFVTDFRYRDQAEKETSGWEIVIETGNRMEVIENLIKKSGSGITGFEAGASYSFYRKLTKTSASLKDTEGIIEKIRQTKQQTEINRITEAVRRAENAFLETKPFVREGRTEKAIAMRLEERLKKNVCRHIPFDIIVASGPNSAMPHARPSDRKLQKGDLVIIDWGGEADCYFSDMTRTFLLKGGNDLNKKKTIYNMVLEANKRAVSAVSSGIKSKGIDSTAREYIRKKGYGDCFGHGTGHGVGLQVHEAPRITWNQSTTLKNNMVFTIEPGIYIPHLGGVRIEDMVVVKQKGCEVLTKLPKDLEII